MPILPIFIVSLLISFALILASSLDFSRDVSDPVLPESSVASESEPPLLPVFAAEEKVVSAPVLQFIEVTAVRKSAYSGETAVAKPEELIALSPPPERTALIRFAFDSAELSFEAQQSLDWAAGIMQQSAGSSALITGYSDSKGNATYNRDLSQRRATAVGDFLMSRGVQGYRLEVQGGGIYDDPGDGVSLGASVAAERARIVQIIIRDVAQ